MKRMGIKIIYNLYFTVIGGGGGEKKAAIFCIRLEKE
jgi:hypothetical protein